MIRFQKILLPVDVNTDPAKQLDAAIKMAHTYKSEIILMYVVPDGGLHEEIAQIIKKAVTESLNEIRNTLTNHKIKVQEPIIAFGNVVESIIQKSNSEGIDLLLLGARNKKTREKYKLGVISEQIIRASDIPVYVVSNNSKDAFDNILCPVDFSEPSKRALQKGMLWAQKYNAKLRIITIYEPLTYVSKRIDIDLEQENANRLKSIKKDMQTFLGEFDLSGIKHTVEIKNGKIEEKILHAIKKHQVDLLIMGTHGRTGLSRFFMGSVTQKVIREMPCSFITTK